MASRTHARPQTLTARSPLARFAASRPLPWSTVQSHTCLVSAQGGALDAGGSRFVEHGRHGKDELPHYAQAIGVHGRPPKGGPPHPNAYHA